MSTSKWKTMGKVAGGALAAGLVAGGALKVAFDIGETYAQAFDKIRVGTGATGKELKGLEKDFRALGKRVPADLGSIGEAVAGINQRLDLTGRPLRKLSTQFLNLSRITETDVAANVQSVTRAFGDWEVKTRDQAKTLDFFFRAAQESGSSVTDLTDLIVQFGAPLRRFGFEVEDATSMFALFEKSGVNIQTMIPGLKLALSDFLERGVDPEKGLLKTFAGIESGAIAADEAIEIFGKRAGADMVEAIEQGRFKFEEFTRTIDKGKDTINGAARDTFGFAEAWQQVKNLVVVTLGPTFDEFFNIIGRGARDALKFMRSDEFKAFGEDMGAVFSALGKVAGPVLQGIKRNFGGVIRIIGGAAEAIGGVLRGDFKAAWEGIKNVFSGAVEAIKGTLETLTAPLRAITSGFRSSAAEAASAWADTFGERLDKAIENKSVPALRRMLNHFRMAQKALLALDWDVDTEELQEQVRESTDRAREALDRFTDKAKDTERDGSKHMRDLGRNSVEASRKMAQGVSGNVGRMVEAVGGGYKVLNENTSRALKAFGVDPQKYTVKKLAQGAAGLASGNLFRQRGGDVPGQGTGDKVPAMLEPGEFVVNRKATDRMRPFLEAINSRIPRFATGGLVGLQPGITRLAKWAADRYGLRISSGLRPGDSGSYHSQGAAVDLVPPSMGATVGIYNAFKNQLAELFYDPWGGFDNGQRIGPIGGHLDHIHAAILGSGGPAAMAAKLARLVLQGPAGPLRAMGQRGLDKVRSAAQKFISRQTMTTHGPIGNISGPLQAIAKRMIASTWGAGQWPFFNDLVMRESGWDPTAVNPSSGAAGLAQALPPSKYPPGAWPYTGKESAVKQLQWMIQYIQGRYGTPAAAIGWHNSHNWYQKGGLVMPPFGGVYHNGGTVPGPVGAERTIVAKGGEYVGSNRPLRIVRGKLSIDESGVAFIEGVAIDAIVDASDELVEHANREIGRNNTRAGQLAGRAGRP